jgi:hypothetical protein
MRARTLFLTILAACGGGASDVDGGGDDAGSDRDAGVPTGNGTVFDPAITRVSVEIDYETGSAPYTGAVIGFGDSFDLSTANLERLFSGTKDLTLPTTLAAMEDVGAIADEELTSSDLLALAAQHRDLEDSSTERTYYLLWVSGNFANGDGVQPGVLGVSIGDTGIVAMFKDVIESTGTVVVPNLERFVEQSVLIHEMGHALGLVDNGVPTTADHHDAEHGAHCRNDQCVMYWLNEGASDMAQFAADSVLASDVILFDDDCLADVDALTGGP